MWSPRTRRYLIKAAAACFVRWIDVLTGMADAHPGWRSDKEKTHVLAQFTEARDIFVTRGEEAAK